MNIGLMLALQIVGLYFILGPLVILGLYILFDRLATKDDSRDKESSELAVPLDLWTSKTIQKYFDNRKNIDKL